MLYGVMKLKHTERKHGDEYIERSKPKSTAEIINVEKQDKNWKRNTLDRCHFCNDPHPDHFGRECPKHERFLPCGICSRSDHLRKNCPDRPKARVGNELNSKERRYLARKEAREIHAGEVSASGDWADDTGKAKDVNMDPKFTKRQTKETVEAVEEEERKKRTISRNLLVPKFVPQSAESKANAKQKRVRAAKTHEIVFEKKVSTNPRKADRKAARARDWNARHGYDTVPAEDAG